ncbi:MAG: hypothetical protein Q9162_001480 [Coniocarpon cinnabarinum]
MGVSKKTTQLGNGVDIPKKGDVVVMSYTGYLHDRQKSGSGGRGKKFDSSKDRGDLTTKLGGGSVIRGWETGVLYADGGMSLGEEATIKIPWQSAYGENDVRLKAINGKRA